MSISEDKSKDTGGGNSLTGGRNGRDTGSICGGGDSAKTLQVKSGFLQYTLVRTRRKSIAVSVDNLGNVKVSAPINLPAGRIEQFVADKAQWAIQKREQALGRMDKLRGLFLAEIILIGGKPYKIERADKRSLQGLTGDTAHIFYSIGEGHAAAETVLAASAKFIKKLAQTELTVRAHYLCKLYNFDKVTQITVTDYRRSWGICNNLGHIKLNYRLVMLPDIVRDYVIMHELCHTLHMNHSSNFWKSLSKFMPGWRESRGQLKRYSALLQLYRG